MAGAIPFIAIAATVAGSALQAKGAIDAGNAAQAAANFNAIADRQRAAATLSQGTADAVVQQQEARRTIGRARAAYGASGLTLEGSPLDVLEASAMASELDKQQLLYKAQVHAIGYTNDAALQTSAGENAVSQSKTQAASAILTGGVKAYSMSGLGTGSTSATPGIGQGTYNYGNPDY